MDINSLEYRDLVDKFGLNKAEDKEAAYEKVLDFFERKGKMKAYKTLMGGAFHTGSYPLISPERVLRSIKEGKVSLSYLATNTNTMVRYLKNVQGMDAVAQREFALTYDKPFYTKIVENTLESNWRNSPLDNDIIKGFINLNTMSERNRCKAIDGCLNPAKMYRKLSPIKQVSTAVAYVKENFGRGDVIKICIPFLKKYFDTIINDVNEEKIITFGKDILMKSSMQEYIKAFCPLINRVLESQIGGRHPYNSPRLKSCSKKFRHIAQYDFVGKPDNWEQMLFKQKGYFGVMDMKGNVIIEPKYNSIGIPRNDIRIALDKDEEVIHYYNRNGELVTGV